MDFRHSSSNFITSSTERGVRSDKDSSASNLVLTIFSVLSMGKLVYSALTSNLTITIPAPLSIPSHSLENGDYSVKRIRFVLPGD